jgi:hypothetical protein
MTGASWMLHGVAPSDAVAPADAPACARVPCGPFDALVSAVDIGLDPAGDAAALARHEALLNAWVCVADVAPARFGLLSSSPDRAAALAASDAAAWRAALDSVAGVVEFSLRILPAARARDADAAAQRHAAAALADRLAAPACARRANPPCPAEDRPRLVDMALLVPREGYPAFRAAVAAAQPDAAEAGLILRLTGPRAAFTFVDAAPLQAAS